MDWKAQLPAFGYSLPKTLLLKRVFFSLFVLLCAIFQVGNLKKKLEINENDQEIIQAVKSSRLFQKKVIMYAETLLD